MACSLALIMEVMRMQKKMVEEGKKRLNKNVSAFPEEIECMKRLASKGINIYYHLVPEEAPQSIDKVLKED